MPKLRQEITNTIDTELLSNVSLPKNKIMGYETPIKASTDNSLHSVFSLFNIAEQFNLNTRLEFICGRYHGLNSRWLRLF
jgi:hypothetical protein